MARLRKDELMVAQQMIERQVPVRQVASQLGVDESSLRYRLSRPAGAPDGRQERLSVLDGLDARVDAVLARFDDPRLRGEVGATALRCHALEGGVQRLDGGTKRQLLREAREGGWRLFFEHDPEIVMGRQGMRRYLSLSR